MHICICWGMFASLEDLGFHWQLAAAISSSSGAQDYIECIQIKEQI